MMRSVSCFVFAIILLVCVSCSRERPFSNIEKFRWVSIEVSYCVGIGPEVTKKTQTITDEDVLSKLRALFVVRTWDYATLHTLSKWNKILISLDNGDNEALVLSPNEACYYAETRNAVTVYLGSSFENYLREVLQKKEDEPVYFYYGYSQGGADISIKNQEAMIIPDDNKWRIEEFPGAEKGRKY